MMPPVQWPTRSQPQSPVRFVADRPAGAAGGGNRQPGL